MDIELKNEEEYDEALREIARLMSVEPEEGSEEWNRLDQLVTAVEKYEDIHYPINLGEE